MQTTTIRNLTPCNKPYRHGGPAASFAPAAYRRFRRSAAPTRRVPPPMTHTLVISNGTISCRLYSESSRSVPKISTQNAVLIINPYSRIFPPFVIPMMFVRIRRRDIGPFLSFPPAFLPPFEGAENQRSRRKRHHPNRYQRQPSSLSGEPPRDQHRHLCEQQNDEARQQTVQPAI